MAVTDKKQAENLAVTIILRTFAIVQSEGAPQ